MLGFACCGSVCHIIFTKPEPTDTEGVITFIQSGENWQGTCRGAFENNGKKWKIVWGSVCVCLCTKVKMCCYQVRPEPHSPIAAELHKHSAPPWDSLFCNHFAEQGDAACAFLPLSESFTSIFLLRLNGSTSLKSFSIKRLFGLLM